MKNKKEFKRLLIGSIVIIIIASTTALIINYASYK